MGNPAGFWGVAEKLHWYKKWDKEIDNSKEG
ncbi:MAG: hypothetical protein J7L90_01450 [Dehalococcoidia bacterium]|nr:hypothetical protein [Dehalococcoidia bacterium]